MPKSSLISAESNFEFQCQEESCAAFSQFPKGLVETSSLGPDYKGQETPRDFVLRSWLDEDEQMDSLLEILVFAASTQSNPPGEADGEETWLQICVLNVVLWSKGRVMDEISCINQTDNSCTDSKEQVASGTPSSSQHRYYHCSTDSNGVDGVETNRQSSYQWLRSHTSAMRVQLSEERLDLRSEV
jgi:hypothetical protein